MVQIKDSEYLRLLSVDLENEKLKAENIFLYSKIQQWNIEMATKEKVIKSLWENKKINDCDMSVRLANELKRMGMVHVSDLIIRCKREGINSLRREIGHGEKSHQEVIAFFKKNKIII